ncbi:MAG: helix-turn-helix transcriptional regulator [Leptolyngbyaceae cyanobacterium SU_3_3]|nr:helix-turn-helix transcriptional regulator [Leptolyngbyaceae cyanobacterium SU_3_3]
MTNTLSTFLNDELKKRGWSQRELARRAELSPTSISEVLSGRRGPGRRFCQSRGASVTSAAGTDFTSGWDSGCAARYRCV